MVVFLYIALAVLILLLLFKRDTRKHKQIPGPKGWPLVGYAPYMKNRKEHEIYSDFAGQYGDIVKLNVFGQTIIVLNSAQLIRAAFNGETYKKHMNDGPLTFYGEHLLWGSQSMCFMHKGYKSDHGRLRKAFTKGLHVYGYGKKEFEDKVKSELANVVEIFKTLEGKDFDMVSVPRRSLTNVMSIILGGHALADDDKDVNMFWEYDKWNDFFLGNYVNVRMTSFPFLRLVPGVYRSAFKMILKAKQTIVQRYFYDKKATYKPGEIRGLIDYLIGEQLDAQKDGTHVLLTDEKIMSMLLETVAAGILTSLSSLSNLFLCLMNHTQYQTKIQAELDRVIGRDRLPTLADKHECVFTEAVIIETQRYLTTVPLSLPHLCIEEIEFEGYEIPSKSLIVPNVWHVHHDTKIWGDPWNFRPERWLDINGDLLPNDHILRTNWLAFSTGRRQCPGESLARSRIFLYVATLLQRWNLEMPPGQNLPCDPRLGHFDINVTCRPKPYMCRVTPRTKASA